MDEDFFPEGIENGQVEIVAGSGDSTDSFLFDDSSRADAAPQSTGDNDDNDYQIIAQQQEDQAQEGVSQEEEKQEVQQESMYTIDDIYDLIQVNTSAINAQSDLLDSISEDIRTGSRNMELVGSSCFGILVAFFSAFVIWLFFSKLN